MEPMVHGYSAVGPKAPPSASKGTFAVKGARCVPHAAPPIWACQVTAQRLRTFTQFTPVGLEVDVYLPHRACENDEKGNRHASSQHAASMTFRGKFYSPKVRV
nr:hypothetical protein CFP56_37378 [Quercus suber]